MTAVVLDRIIRGVQFDLGDLGVELRRMGTTQGTVWAEWSGGLADGTRVMLRVRHRVRRGNGLIRAGLLLTRPLRYGGKTELAGEAAHDYTVDAVEAEQQLIEDIQHWVRQVARSDMVVAGASVERW